MRRFRFTIASLVVLVGFAAFGAAALRAADAAWDSGVFALTLTILLLASLKTIHGRGRSRAFWLGFALFGGGYLVASLIPPVASRLPTSRGLSWLDEKRSAASIKLYNNLTIDLDRDGREDVFVATTTPTTLRNVNPPAPPPDQTIVNLQKVFASFGVSAQAGGTSQDFLAIGHSLCALILALAGGVISRAIADREEKNRSIAETAS